MKIHFEYAGNLEIVDWDKQILRIGRHQYIDIDGNPIVVVPDIYDDDYDDEFNGYEIAYEGLDKPLKSFTTIEPESEIDDLFGNFGYKDKEGNVVIEPQYAWAYEFTNGLACVNLNRTWYRTEDGKRFYENHYGYINNRGETVIPFRFEEAKPFNKYGVAVVYEDYKKDSFLIDLEGNEIPGTRFPYISPYYDYDDRFFLFSSQEEDDDVPNGIYDTKERKILWEPCVEDIIEWNEEFIAVYDMDSPNRPSRYVNSKGEEIYKWLYNTEFNLHTYPDKKGRAVVYIRKGKNNSDGMIWGLYCSKEKFILPLEYDHICRVSGDIFLVKKQGIHSVVEIEDSDF